MKRFSKSVLSLFRDSESQPSKYADSEMQPPRRMELEERQAYRKKKLIQAIRETFVSMGVDDSQCTFTVVPTDVRHHRFTVMLDVARSFLAVDAARTMSFAEIEVLIRTHTYNRFGILGVAMYWRVAEAEVPFQHSTRSTVAVDSTWEPMAPLPVPDADHIRTYSMQVPILALDADQPPTDEDSENLDDGIMIGGTQYGKF